MKRRAVTFALPGPAGRMTGAHVYDRSLAAALRADGRVVADLLMPEGFPAASQAELDTAAALLAALPPDMPAIVDGFVYGAVDTAALGRVRAPLVAMIHHPLGLETGLAPGQARALVAREAANLQLAAHVLVPSQHTARVLAADFGVAPARITLAPPGIPRPAAAGRPAHPPLILAAGALIARKGHDVLVRALARIADLPWQAEIAGPPDDPAVASALARQVAGAGLGPRVRLSGVLAPEALAARFAAASVFALASRYEGYGMVFAEALARGLPIVACRAGAVPDTVPAGAGLLVDVDDDAAFAAALRLVLTRPARRRAMATAALAAGRALPGWPETAARVGAVLDRL